jgi:hypothetical protein
MPRLCKYGHGEIAGDNAVTVTCGEDGRKSQACRECRRKSARDSRRAAYEKNRRVCKRGHRWNRLTASQCPVCKRGVQRAYEERKRCGRDGAPVPVEFKRKRIKRKLFVLPATDWRAQLYREEAAKRGYRLEKCA